MTINYLTEILEKYQYPREEPRNYIGASSIGSDCLRQIWYELNGLQGEGVPNKLKRTWEIGRVLEIMILHLLKEAGIEFDSFQIDLVDAEFPYFQGHFDAIISNPLSILEIKTAKDASYKVFVKKGLFLWQPKYYAQLQSYMGMSGIYNAYILVLNKDNSEISDELVTFDELYYQRLKIKAKMIYEAKVAPMRISNNPLWHQCKKCKFRKICHAK